MKQFANVSHTVMLLTALLLAPLASLHAQTNGPLRVHPVNPRYFADASGKAILLAGSHTWNNLVDIGPDDPPQPIDFDAYLLWLKAHGQFHSRLDLGTDSLGYHGDAERSLAERQPSCQSSSLAANRAGAGAGWQCEV